MKIGIAGPVLFSSLAEFLDLPPGGASSLPRGLGGTPVVHLIRELLRRGRKVVVFTLDPEVRSGQVFQGDSLKIHVGPMRPRARDRALDGFSRERGYLRSAISGEDVDVVHAHWTYEFALGALATGKPTLVTAHDSPYTVLRFMPNAYRLIRLAMACQVGRKTKHLTAVSPYLAEQWKRWRLFNGEIRVIPNGLPESLFHHGTKPSRERDGKVVFSFVGDWGRRKNGKALLKAFRIALEAVPESRLLLFGPGLGPRQEAEQWARKVSLHNGVVFAGNIPNDDLQYRLAEEVDILVHPALEEANPMAVVEAMAKRLPVIGGRCSGGVPYTLDYGRAGMLVDVLSVDELAEAMIRLARNPGERKELAESGYSFARTVFSIDTVAAAYEKEYEALVGTF